MGYLAMGSCLAMIAGITYHLCANLGRVMNPAISLSVSLTSQIVLLTQVNCSTVHGILIYGIFSALIQYIMWVIYFIHISEDRGSGSRWPQLAPA